MGGWGSKLPGSLGPVHLETEGRLLVVADGPNCSVYARLGRREAWFSEEESVSSFDSGSLGK